MQFTKTELHTHFMGMLTPKELLNLCKEYTDFIYWPLDKPITQTTTFHKIDDILNTEFYLEKLQIKRGVQVDYDKLDSYYISRTSIINFLTSIYFISNGKIPYTVNDIKNNKQLINTINRNNNELVSKTDGECFLELMNIISQQKKINHEKELYAKKEVFSNYINKCLLELINMGIKYVEISYSNDDIISLIEISPEIKEKIKCKFLLSTSRDRSVKQMLNSASKLEYALKKGMTVGFDIMGEESILTDIEKIYSTGNKSRSFKRKLEILIDSLLKYKENNPTLRIHSGESKISLGNTEWILDTLKEIKEKYLLINPNLKIFPPPEIRIGHGIYFEKNEKYIERLKELGAIIEINASSNLALKNIDSYRDLPYDYYLSNNIPIVISTDGHGLYNTSIKIENIIASEISQNYSEILKKDEEIFEEKVIK